MKVVVAGVVLMLGVAIATIVKHEVHLHGWDPDILIAMTTGTIFGYLIKGS